MLGAKRHRANSTTARGSAARASPTFAIPRPGEHSDMGGKMLINNGGIMTCCAAAAVKTQPEGSERPARRQRATAGIGHYEQKKPPQWGGS